MTAPLLDLVIAVHTTTRPIRRAVASVLESAGDRVRKVRVTVVCHEVPLGDIAALIADLPPERVRLMTHSDGVPSPAGPMNVGIAAAEAEYVAVMGSDDFFEPGAIEAYLAEVERSGADVLLVPLRYQGGELLHNPLPRRGRRARLDPVRDRLLYRSSPLALIRRSVLVGMPGPFLVGMPSGEDLELSTWLWTRPLRIDLAANAPAYVIGAESDDRVSMGAHPLTVVMAPLRHLITRPWVDHLSRATRRALGIKLLRIHVLGALRARGRAEDWTPEDARLLAEVVRGCVALAPSVLAPFSIVEDRAFMAILTTPPSIEGALDALARSATPSWRARTLPRRLVRSLDRESTLTRFLLYRFDRWGVS